MTQPHPARTTVNWRDRVVVFLAFLTSSECLDACKRQARPEELAGALTRIWFDDIYVPGEEYVDGLKGTNRDEHITVFNACFSEEERESLARFHGFFELRLDFLTNSVLGRGFFPENDSWQSILKHASYLLDELDPEPDWVRHMLASLASQPPRLLVSSLRGQTLPSQCTTGAPTR